MSPIVKEAMVYFAVLTASVLLVWHGLTYLFSINETAATFVAILLMVNGLRAVLMGISCFAVEVVQQKQRASTGNKT